MRKPFSVGVLVAAVAPAAVAVLTAPVSAADPVADPVTINDLVGRGPLEQPFYGYLYRNGYGYLNSQKAGEDGRIACVNDLEGVPVSQIISLLEMRGNSTDEAQAIVFAMQKQTNSNAYEPLC